MRDRIREIVNNITLRLNEKKKADTGYMIFILYMYEYIKKGFLCSGKNGY